MLSFLHIENIAVIKKLDIDFASGFTALTGETGAGKSIIIDGIGLLMGERGSRELIRSGEESATVNAIFENIGEEARGALAELDIFPDENGSISVSRIIYADGRSKGKINGQTVQISQMREAAKQLISVHSQHESQSLLDTSAHIRYLDAYIPARELDSVKKEYTATFEEFAEIRQKLNALKEKNSEKERLRELLEYQLKDIESAKLKPDEDTELDGRLKLLRSAEKLAKGTDFVYRALVKNGGSLSAVDLIEKSRTALVSLAKYLPEAEELAQKLEGYKYEIQDIGERTLDFLPDIDNAPAELDRAEARLDVISRLKRKYGGSVNEVLKFKEKIEAELDELELGDTLIAEYGEKYKVLEGKLKANAEALHALRAKYAEMLGKAITDELAYLDMKGARVKVSAELKNDVGEYTSSGADTVELLISANPGEELKSMSKTASGGELSRVMLAIKSELVGKMPAETVIFDEIDTGVSGKTSEKIGLRLKRIAKGSQVFCITHAAQIAALAHTHLYISKAERDGRNETSVKELDFEERVRECARIGSGVNITEKQIAAARELVLAGAKAEV